MPDQKWRAIFTDNKPILFNFHSYPWLIHRLTYKRPGQHNLHVRGYREKGNIDTPFELALRNGTDRYSLAVDAIDLIGSLGNTGSSAREKFTKFQLQGKNEAFTNGIDPEYIRNWTWPYPKKA
jgi:xylulose-5-phosphate/fructose-6-phosphate phosphoketolase